MARDKKSKPGRIRGARNPYPIITKHVRQNLHILLRSLLRCKIANQRKQLQLQILSVGWSKSTHQQQTRKVVFVFPSERNAG